MPRRTKEEAEQTRQHLLNTALRLFAERGISRTNLKDVATEADLTHGALYWHFKNKADLIEALYADCRLDLDDIYLDQLQSARQNALESLGDFIYQWSLRVIQDERSAQIWQVFHSGSSTEPELKALAPQIKAEHKEWIGLLSKFVKKARKQELIDAKRSGKDQVPLSAIATVMGISASSQTLSKDLVSVKPLAKHMVSAFIGGLQTH